MATLQACLPTSLCEMGILTAALVIPSKLKPSSLTQHQSLLHSLNSKAFFTHSTAKLAFSSPEKKTQEESVNSPGNYELLLSRLGPLSSGDSEEDASGKVGDGSKSVATAAAMVLPALVYISVWWMDGKTWKNVAGSGTIIDSDGTILTCAHLLSGKGGERVFNSKRKVDVTLQDGRTFVGTVLNEDIHSDIAILKITSTTPFPPAKLGSSCKLHPGEWVVAMGSPCSLKNTVTAGIVSCVGRKSSELGIGGMLREYIQTDCAINLGNSGGPLVNLDGEVVAVNIFGRAAATGLHFAVPIDSVSRIMKHFTTNGYVLQVKTGTFALIKVNQFISSSHGNACCRHDTAPLYTRATKRLHHVHKDYEPNQLEFYKLNFRSTSKIGTGHLQESPCAIELASASNLLSALPSISLPYFWRVIRPWLGLKMLDLNEAIITQLKDRDPMFANISKGVLIFMLRGLRYLCLIASSKMEDVMALPVVSLGAHSAQASELARKLFNSRSKVTPGSPADLAGLRPGDVVVKFHGTPVGSITEITELMGDKVGMPFKVVVKRANDTSVTSTVVPEEINPEL
ncbi:hypothetical protein RJ640_024756 [Escallonia rubra]|uniref:PDZ domain-containing protein n=1 Tax=Escallonia rubra TaxID=112253 RepID=A0AA88R624_9ASTE|nr:hypothetical protein RJ640_024756 [Escallonia rubra]